MVTVSAQVSDSVIKSLFGRDISGQAMERIEASIGRVVAEESLNTSDFDLDEITDSVVAEEFRDLPEDVSDVLYEGVVRSVNARLAEIVREEVRMYLSQIGSKVTA
jgi:hypothetical protein